jgi:hypothetical protein
MIEDEGKPIRIEKDGLKIRVGRYAIETVKIFRKTDS